MTTRQTPLLIALSLLLLPALPAAADTARRHTCARCSAHRLSSDPPAFDPASGRSLLNYPPHRDLDVEHLKLELDIPSMDRRELTATATLVFSPISRPIASTTLHAAPAPHMTIISCTAEAFATRATFAHTGSDLAVSFDPPIPVAQRVHLVIHYTLSDPPEGLYWLTEQGAAAASISGLPKSAQIWSQGQPESNRFWIPFFDSPNERLSSDLFITVPRGYQAISNGFLGSRTERGGTESFHWVQKDDHAPYLVSLVVGKFATVDVAPAGSGLPLPVYLPREWADRVPRTFGRTPRMIDEFSRLIDEPYPWAKYAQTLVWDYAWGGMENTSATTLFDTCALDEAAFLDGDQDALIAHELAHQWFGDLLTCNSWEHLWLNEGFATFFEAVWEERREEHATDAARREAYFAALWPYSESILAADSGSAPATPGMASKAYRHPDDTFTRAADPYGKGALVLHALRARLGDAAFWRGIAAYVDARKHGTVETLDLRRALEDSSGLDLSRFFDQHVRRPGIPRIDLTLSYDPASRQLTALAKQTQTINGDNPAFDLDIPIWLTTADSDSPRILRLAFDTREALRTWDLDVEPAALAVDPSLSTLADYTLRCPAAWQLAALTTCPDLPGRLRALNHLAALQPSERPPETAAAIESSLNSPAAHRTLRSAAAHALASLQDTPRLLAAARAHPADPRTRRAIYDALASAPDHDGLGDLLTSAAQREESPAAAAAAIRALGEHKLDSARPVIIAALSRDSWDDQIRTAALEALAKFDRAEDIDHILPFTRRGHLSSTRAAAITALGALSHHFDARPDLGTIAHKYSGLVLPSQALHDREIRVALAAAETFVSSASRGESATIVARTWLTPRAQSDPSPSMRNAFRNALDRLPALPPPPTPARMNAP